MSFLLRKIINSWNAATETSVMVVQAPVCPPTPDLSHLNPDEIRVIHEVLRKQEEFERQEEGRARRLQDELDSYQRQLHRKSDISPQDRRNIDLQLCRLCFKTKFDEGAGRVCSDCQQRVCQQCGSFTRSRGCMRVPRMEGQWRCKLCLAQREVMCRTGGWYHGASAELSQQVKKMLSATSSPEGEKDIKETVGRKLKVADNNHCPPVNRKISDVPPKVPASQNSRQAPITERPRRQSQHHDAQDLDKMKDDPMDGDKKSLKKMMLERQLSRRRRQEKLHRQRLKTNVKKTPTLDESKGDSADYSDTNSSTFSSFSDSSKSHFSSPTHTAMKGKPQSEVAATVTNSKDLRRHSKLDIKVNSDRKRKSSSESKRSHSVTCVSQRKQSITCETQRSQSVTSDQIIKVKSVPETKPAEKQTSIESGEKSLQKWRQSGFSNVYLLLLHCRPTGSLYGLKVTGGVQDDPENTKAFVSWVSSDIKNSICEGQEVLEWNGKVFKGQTYDYVNSITSQVCSSVLLIVNPTTERDESKPLCVGGSLSSQDVALKQSSEIQTGKSRILPRIPTDTQQNNSPVKGEMQIKICYQAEKAVLTVSVVKVRHFADTSESGSCKMFAVVNLVPGRSRACLEHELQISSGNTEWNQTFVISGVSLTELAAKCIQLTVWNRDETYDQFKGEVLIDLSETPLDSKVYWYSLEEHDENSPPLPHHRKNSLLVDSSNWMNHSYKGSPIMCPTVSPEVPMKRNSSPSTGSSNVSPVPFGTSQNVSTDSHHSNVSHPDSFTDKVKKKMKKTVSKMSPLSFTEKKDSTDESLCSEVLRRLSNKSDKSIPVTKSPKLQKSNYIFNQNLDLLAPPRPLSRASSCSSVLMSDEEEEPRPSSQPSLSSDRPPPDGDDITSTLGPGQIPPKPSAETTLCGDIRLGFMVSKGQLEVDVICAASLNWDRQIQPPDTFVKTCLVEGKKVIQSKKTNVVKTSADPGYHKKIKYSASNVHGRIMKVAVWKRGNSSDKKACLGEALVRLDLLDLSKSTVAWYKLFKMNSTEYGSDEFLNSW